MRNVLLLFLCACLYAAEAPLYLFYPNAPSHKAVENVSIGTVNDAIATVAPADGAVVPLLSERHKAYLDLMPREKRIELYADTAFRTELTKARSNPLVVHLVWPAKMAAAKEAELFISENADLSNAVAIAVPANRARKTDDGSFRYQLELNNLKVATAYYWMVRIGDDVTPVATFSTEARAPRLLRIYGVPNVRELGGYIGLDGRRTRQGMLYRTSGLNDNATKLYTTEEEAKALYPELIQKAAALQEKISKWEKQLGEVENVRILPVALSHEWTVFLPQSATTEDYKAFCQLTAIPDDFLGAASQQLSTDEKWSYTFSKPIERAPAMFAQTIEADEDGYMILGCGADWWWMLGVNGEIICDRLSTKDNVEWPANVDNHALLVPLRKGTNLITPWMYLIKHTHVLPPTFAAHYTTFSAAPTICAARPEHSHIR
ncbi:MAG: tyrosine-protein phosphatase, partial [Lentisphaeria bacterium]|nr:tyrosine-protein phosphatase [Lentisphaeria bacterium]